MLRAPTGDKPDLFFERMILFAAYGVSVSVGQREGNYLLAQ